MDDNFNLPPMRRDIARQPAVVEAVIARADEFISLGRGILCPGPGGKVIVLGCGDGWFAAQAAAGFAVEAGLDWRPTSALDMILSAGSLRPVDRVIAISMSGNVDRTVEAAKRVDSAGVPLLAVVNGTGGRLGEIAARKVSLDVLDLAPFLCGTASYSATLTALMLLAAGAAGNLGITQRLKNVPAAQTAAVLAADTGIAALVDVPTGVRLLSAGANLATAQYGAAKFVELTRIPAWANDLEEFAHSQYWSMPTSDLVVVVAIDPVLARYADDACEALSRLGVQTIAVDALSAPVINATARLTLCDLEPGVAPLVTALPLQVLAYRLAEMSGFDPNRRQHLKEDEARFLVSRLLTRRSLVGTGQ